ncbi:MAG: lipid A export permease/ATP-binding protein MsbA [Deltaproteobacteria bacterium]|nr:lipid A export permease/ATP-binding protein MsbA [Deltaproteobacteria bacterium]
MKLYFKLLKFVVPHWLCLAGAICCMILLALSTGAMAYLIGPVLKFLFTNEGGDIIKIIPFGLLDIDRASMIIAIPLLIIAVAVIKGVSFFWQSYLMGYVGQRVVLDIREKLYKHMLAMPIPFFTKTHTGSLISRVTNDVNQIQNTATDSLASLIRESLTIIVLAAVVIKQDWKLAAIAFIAFPLAVYPMIRFSKKLRKVSTQGQVTMGTITSLLQEAISGIRIVKAFCMEAYEEIRFNKESERLNKLQMKSIKVRAVSSPMMEMFGVVGFAATIWYASYRINMGDLTPEGFISFFAAVLMLYQPIKALNGVNLNIQKGLAAASRVFEILEMQEEKKDKSGAVELEDITNEVAFKDVSFKYGENLVPASSKQGWVLKDINLNVKKGEIIAIVGTSGGGKTTLVNLIPRFYDVVDGSIIIDGIDTRDIKLKSLREQIAIVSQQVILFNDTVKRNIAYGDFAKTDEEIIMAAKAANAHNFIERLPEGYNTVIGEGGVRLSGGERQRLSIARAILKNAPILILDEATSSLDTESEMEVQKGLNNLMQGRTTFVIAHRLSTIRNADRIIVLAHGTIKEEGRHEELLKLNGEYFRIYNMQFHDVSKESSNTEKAAT